MRLLLDTNVLVYFLYSDDYFRKFSRYERHGLNFIYNER